MVQPSQKPAGKLQPYEFNSLEDIYCDYCIKFKGGIKREEMQEGVLCRIETLSLSQIHTGALEGLS